MLLARAACQAQSLAIETVRLLAIRSGSVGTCLISRRDCGRGHGGGRRDGRTLLMLGFNVVAPVHLGGGGDCAQLCLLVLLLPKFGAPILEPDLDARFGQADLVGGLLAQEHVWILRLLEQILQDVQLLSGEGGPLAALLTGRLLRRKRGKDVGILVNVHCLLVVRGA